MLRGLLLALSTRRRLGDVLDRFRVSRRLVRRFVAGTTPGEALDVLARVCAQGLTGAVTYLGENVATENAARQATDTYVGLLDHIERRRLPVIPSLKLTHLGLDLSESLCVANLARVAERAARARTRLWVDMESTAYTDTTLRLYAKLRPQHAHLACVVQAYLRRTPDDVERLIELGAAVRVCKGAYREPPALAFPDKRDVDAAYARLIDRLLAPDALARGVYPGFATHDERMQARVRERAAAGRVEAGRFEVQMLFGIRPELHARLRGQGLAVRVLVPFGEDWYGYFMRRLAERPANLLFLLRNLARR